MGALDVIHFHLAQYLPFGALWSSRTPGWGSDNSKMLHTLMALPFHSPPMKSGLTGVAEPSSSSLLECDSGLHSTFTPLDNLEALTPSSPLVRSNVGRQTRMAYVCISFPLPEQGARAGPGVDPAAPSESLNPRTSHCPLGS